MPKVSDELSAFSLPTSLVGLYLDLHQMKLVGEGHGADRSGSPRRS